MPNCCAPMINGARRCQRVANVGTLYSADTCDPVVRNTFLKGDSYPVSDIARMDGTGPLWSSGCSIPRFDGAVFSSREWKDARWARFSTGGPRRRRQSVERYTARPGSGHSFSRAGVRSRVGYRQPSRAREWTGIGAARRRNSPSRVLRLARQLRSDWHPWSSPATPNWPVRHEGSSARGQGTRKRQAAHAAAAASRMGGRCLAGVARARLGRSVDGVAT
jgi:hypothetical protein